MHPTAICPSPVLQNLVHKKILGNRLQVLFGREGATLEKTLHELAAGRPTRTESLHPFLPRLLEQGYLTPEHPSGTAWGSIFFCKALNIELTYRCTKRCPHCGQLSIRDSIRSELPANAIKEAIHHAYMSGICSRGINFTGGEPLGHRDDLLEIIDYTASLGIPFRLNTNSWWAEKRNLHIGGRTFDTPADLVRYLHRAGMAKMAFSYDIRYQQDNHRLGDLLASIMVCEDNGVPYQLIFSSVTGAQLAATVASLRSLTGNILSNMEIMFSELIDVGGASDLDNSFEHQANASPCEGKGFTRPQYLHISPDGKVRSCMFAFGACNVGDLSKESLSSMLNRFPYSGGAKTFTDTKEIILDEKRLIEPFLQHYKPFRHECTRNIVLSRTIEMTEKKPERELLDIHQEIAGDLNLKRNHE